MYTLNFLVVAVIGSAIFGFRVGQKELQIRALYQKKNELLASQAENQLPDNQMVATK